MEMRRRGFTLIELLVVIAIIAILAAILFPVFTEAQRRSKMATCMNNLKQLGLAFRQYTDDNSGRMPKVGRSSSRLPNWCGARGGGGWCILEEGQIYKYTKNKDLYLCPTDKKMKAKYISTSTIPPGLTQADFPLSYSMNDYLDLAIAETLPMVRNSMCMLLIHEERERINDGIFQPKMPPGQDIPDNVHYTGTTLIYLDGHAKWDDYKALYKECDDGYWTPTDKWPKK